jgi:hypothetical protein
MFGVNFASEQRVAAAEQIYAESRDLRDLSRFPDRMPSAIV